MAWGVCVVSTADNVIRPLVISGATKIPFLLIMFGVLGGLASFGMVGLFVGPVILAVLLAIWREWLHETQIEPVMMPKASMVHHLDDSDIDNLDLHNLGLDDNLNDVNTHDIDSHDQDSSPKK